MIDSNNKLEEILPTIAGADWMAIDTEADSLHSYPEKLCLIQISIPGADYLVDPLAGFDLTPLLAHLKERELIFHAGDYDLRLLQRAFGFVPATMFDTMWAARLVGHREFGLQRLVQIHLGVSLEKGPQKADWSRRPLTERMITYARNDTRHLKPLADSLRERLRELGRLEWLQETCRAQVRDSTRPREADGDLVWRLSGSDRLDPRGLAFLRSIWQWREREALQSNRPPFFIVEHSRLVQIASAASQGVDWRNMIPHRLPRSRRERLIAAIEESSALPKDAWPQRLHNRSRRWTAVERRRFVELEKRRDHAAHALGIDPTLIANRSTLGALAENWQTGTSFLLNWQKQLLEEQDLPVPPSEDSGSAPRGLSPASAIT